MKKLLFNFLLIAVLTACEREPFELSQPNNPLVGTSWTAEDWISAIIYGEGTTTNQNSLKL